MSEKIVMILTKQYYDTWIMGSHDEDEFESKQEYAEVKKIQDFFLNASLEILDATDTSQVVICLQITPDNVMDFLSYYLCEDESYLGMEDVREYEEYERMISEGKGQEFREFNFWNVIDLHYKTDELLKMLGISTTPDSFSAKFFEGRGIYKLMQMFERADAEEEEIVFPNEWETLKALSLPTVELAKIAIEAWNKKYPHI